MSLAYSKYHNILYAIIFALLFLPLLERNSHFIGIKKLDGAFVPKDTVPTFTFKNWFNGDYQRQEEGIANDSFGFRNIYVRLRNQIDYSFFKMSHSQNIVIGKENYLYETHYIDGYYGTEYDGINNIKTVFNKLQFINDTLARQGKTLVLVIAPSKAIFYPEYLPNGPKTNNDSTNYDGWLSLLKNSSIHYIDFNSYFLANKYKSKYPLEPKNGMHWTLYGASLAGDSLVKYLETVRHISMPKPVWEKVILSSDTLADADAEKSMDLLFDMESPVMAYPVVKFQDDPTKTKPNVLTIGDSYFWALAIDYHIIDAFAPPKTFWYYFRSIEHAMPNRQDVKNELNKNDVVLMIATTHNLLTLGWGFIDTAYSMYKGIYPINHNSPEYQEKIRKTKSQIQATAEWFKQVQDGAKQRGISVDSALTLNAIWVVDHDNGK